MYRHRFNFERLSYDQKSGWVSAFLDSISKESSEENIEKVIELVESFNNYYYWEEEDNEQ